MKKKELMLSILGISLVLILAFFLYLNPLNKKVKSPKKATYCVSVPISNFTSTNLPCINVVIEDKTYLLCLDLGFTGNVSINSEVIEQINNKTFKKNKTMYGWMGKKYERNVYEIPKIGIGSITFKNLLLHEENADFRRDSTIIIPEGKEPSFSPESGKIGWTLLNHTNVFLDLGNSIIDFCDSFETLEKKGCSKNAFAKAPLLLDRNLLEIEILTSNGLMRCLLDTGCTWNILHVEADESPEKMAINPDCISEINEIWVEHKNLGPLTFRQLPIKIPIQAILGMDFFMAHQVFIDFANKQVYIRPNKDIPKL